MSEFEKAEAMVVALEHLLYLKTAFGREELTREKCQEVRTQVELAASDMSIATFDELMHRIALVELSFDTYPHAPSLGP